MTDLDNLLRKFTLDKLEALEVIANDPGSVVSTTTISGALTKVGQELGGTISSLARTKIDGEPLIVPAGKSQEEGILWHLNEKVASKDLIKTLVDEILEQNKEFRLQK